MGHQIIGQCHPGRSGKTLLIKARYRQEAGIIAVFRLMDVGGFSWQEGNGESAWFRRESPDEV